MRTHPVVAAGLLLLPCALLVAAVPARAEDPPGFRESRACERLARQLGRLEWAGALGEADIPRLLRERLILRTAKRYADRCVALNQVQVRGTHNSYHVQPRPALFQVLLFFDPVLFLAWEYTHAPLAEQFDRLGVRQIELDVFADPQGGLYGIRRGLSVIGQDPVAPDPDLFAPGLKVLHVQDLDFETTCPTLQRCLAEVAAWSADHPGHLPLMVLVEVKDEVIPDPLNLGFTVPLPFGPEELDDLDAEIRAVFADDHLLTPDDVRRPGLTLEESVLTRGWPTLGEARGRVLFALDNGGGPRLDYVAGAPSLEGRVLFTNGVPGEPDAAFVKRNDPLADFAEIVDLVRAGYVVRTRADADTLEARTGDPTRREAALASGAQFVSTDYPEPDPGFGTGYAVEIPDGMPGRCNPVNAPPGCREAALERH